MRRKQALHQILQAVRFIDDDLRVLAQSRVVEFMLQQLRRPTNAAQRVLDFMRQIADQLTAGNRLFEQALFTRRPQLLVDWPELDK